MADVEEQPTVGDELQVDEMEQETKQETETPEKEQPAPEASAVDDDKAADSLSDEDSDDSSSGGYPEEDLEPTYKDSLKDMTYGRWIARKLGNNSWYYPQAKTRKAYEEAAERVRAAAEEDAKKGGVVRGKSVIVDNVLKPPSLDSAWAYFEHFTLPRYLLKPSEKQEGDEADEEGGGEAETESGAKGETRPTGSSEAHSRNLLDMTPFRTDAFERAEPGEHERETRLYPIWETPEAQLADFGIGVGLYFNTLRILVFILTIAGLINVPVIMYYKSTDYSASGQASVKGVLQGSAICSETDTKWQACPTCTPDQWSGFPKVEDRYAEIVNDNGDILHFIKNNNCHVDFMPGLANWISLLFIIVALYVLSVLSGKKEVAFDEAHQTMTDYSIEVVKPPKDARDPEEWKQFFSQISKDSHVTACTVALDNEELVRALVVRRQMLVKLHMFMPPGTKLTLKNLKRQMDEMPPYSCWWWLYMAIMQFTFSARGLYKNILALTEKIDELAKKEYDVSHVFVTFETEKAQRNALEALSVRKMDIWKNNLEALPENLRFRGEHVLNIREPAEPDAVRWEDLDERMHQRIIQQTITTILTMICVVAGGALIAAARMYSAGLAALVITALNTATPIIVKQIINFESHASEGSKQTSLYVKMTAIRWVNTAIVTTIIEPFTDTVAEGDQFLLQSIYAIFFAELVQTPIMLGTDYMGNLKRHFFGPRIKDQRMMINLAGFMGGYYTLAERYTDMSKVLFLTFFYCLLFPGGFFFAAGALVMHYWTSKYCLLRTWKRAPTIGTHLGYFSRQFIFPLTILAFGIMSAYNYGSFPFDNACNSEVPVSDEYVVGNTTAETLGGKMVDVSITSDDTEFYYCFQDLIKFGVFPPTDRKVHGEPWMTEGQERMTSIYGWTTVAVLVWVLLVYINRYFVSWLRTVFSKTYKPSGKAMDVGFSEVSEIFGYVPQVTVFGSNFPGIICDVDGLDKDMIGWSDPYHSHDVHNLIFDIPSVRKRIKERRHKMKAGQGESVQETEEDVTKALLFSVVKHWPPPNTET